MVSIWLTRVRGRRKFSTEKIGFSAYSAKVASRFCDQNTRNLSWSVFLRQTGFHFAGKAPYEADFLKNAVGSERRLLAVLLDPRGAEPCKAMLVDGELPGQEFVDGQRVAAASLLEGEQAAANRRNDFGLATDDPSLGSGCRQIRNR
jgi:hypothetical protein